MTTELVHVWDIENNQNVCAGCQFFDSPKASPLCEGQCGTEAEKRGLNNEYVFYDAAVYTAWRLKQ